MLPSPLLFWTVSCITIDDGLQPYYYTIRLYETGV